VYCSPQRPAELFLRCTFTDFKLPLISPNISCSQRPRQPFRRSIQVWLLRLGPSGYGAALPDAIFMIPCRRFPRHVCAYLIKIFGALSNNTANFGTSALAPFMWMTVHGTSADSSHPKSFLPLSKRLQNPTKRWHNTTRRRILQDVSLTLPVVQHSNLIFPEMTSLNYTRSETRL